jgi:MFS family permease
MKAWYALVVLMIAFMVAMIDRIIMSLMVGPIQADFHLTDTQFGLLGGLAFALFYSVMGLPIGRLADRASRKLIITVGIATWSAMTILCGLAQSYAYLFIARVGVGVGEASLTPSAYSMLADLFPSDRLGRAMAIYNAGALMGTGMSFALGGGIVAAILAHGTSITLPLFGDVRSWQAAFIAVGAPGFLVALLLLTVAEPSRNRSPSKAATSWRALAHYLAEHKKTYSVYIGSACCQSVLFYGFFAWMPAWFVRHFQLGPGSAGLMVGIGVGVAGPIGAFMGGALADHWLRVGRNDAHMRVGLTSAIGAMPFIVSIPFADTWVAALVIVLGIFVFLSFSASSAAAGLQLITPSHFRAQISALYVMFTGIAGLVLGSLAIALVTDHVYHDKANVGGSMAIVGGVFAPLMGAGYYFGRRLFGVAYQRARASALLPG